MTRFFGDRSSITRRLGRLSVFLGGLLGAVLPAHAAKAPEVARSERAVVTLLSDSDAIAPGGVFTLALKQKLSPGWHSYWRNPGAVGLPTTVEWTAPEGVEIGEILWPTPQRETIGRFVNFGYSKEAILLMEARLPKSWPLGKALELAAEASWLVCKDRCYTESQSFTLSLPVAAKARTDFTAALDIARGRASLPPDTRSAARYRIDGGRLLLEVDAPEFAKPGVSEVFFFPRAETVADPSAPQWLKLREDGPALSIARKAPDKAEPGFEPPLRGVLAAWDRSGAKPVRLAIQISAGLDAGVQAFALSNAAGAAASSSGGGAAVSEAGAVGGASAVKEGVPPPQSLGLGLSAGLGAAMLLAFLGGLILNLMPCVFPVLALKAMSLARAAEHGGAAARREGLAHGLAYAAGVMLSFLAFAAALLALRSAGVAAGWGFQLQNPALVALLAYLLVAVGLNFSGVFELSGSFAGFGASLADKGGRLGDFFTGVLAAVVAAPCTAPFMGAALGYAITQNAATALLVFAALGLGFAAPIVALAASPAIGGMLPRPGPWMARFRQILAFPLYLAAAWLFWVLGNQIGPDGLFLALIGAVLLAFALWLMGEGFPQSASAKTAARLAAAAALLGAAFALQPSFFPTPRVETRSAGGLGEPFDPARLQALREANKTVFVNVTADWCISCKVNEANVLSGERFAQTLARADAVYVKGDWTVQDADVTAFLARFDRISVPLYVVYPKGGAPKMLPQILTQDILEQALGLP